MAKEISSFFGKKNWEICVLDLINKEKSKERSSPLIESYLSHLSILNEDFQYLISYDKNYSSKEMKWIKLSNMEITKVSIPETFISPLVNPIVHNESIYLIGKTSIDEKYQILQIDLKTFQLETNLDIPNYVLHGNEFCFLTQIQSLCYLKIIVISSFII